MKMLHGTSTLLRHVNQSCFRLHKLTHLPSFEPQRTKRGLAIILGGNFGSKAKAQATQRLCSYSSKSQGHVNQDGTQDDALNYTQNGQPGKAALQQGNIGRYHSLPIGQKDHTSKGSVEPLEHSIEAQVRRVDPLLLRDQCQCQSCVDPDSHQKLFQSSDIPSGIRLCHVTPKENEAFLQWENDVPGYSKDHVTRINLSRINELFGHESSRRPTTWDRALFEKHFRKWSWPNVRKSSKILYALLEELDNHGLVFLGDMPQLEADEEASSTQGVEQIGAEIGPLRDSLYGRTWDVRSVANAKNIAYTHQYLGLHMDLLYMKSPPTFQILHCLQASASGGGASVFVDAFRAADTILSNSKIPNLSQHPLCNYLVPYHYHHVHPSSSSSSSLQHQHSHAYRAAHPVIELDRTHTHVAHVNWSPPFQAPLRPALPPQQQLLRAWHGAAREFGRVVERADLRFERLLGPGEAVVFNNRRVLHARRAFDVARAPRWLKGAYVDGDSVASKLRVLRELWGAMK